MPLPAIALALVLLLAAASSVAALNNYESERWMSQNAENSDVVVLPSGLQYKILEKGSGTDSPTADSPCLCHYEGTLIDGTKFDSSYDRGEPTTFAPNQVIAGWTEALQFMVEGDKLQLFIPSDLAYGDRGSPPKINAGDALIFTIELIKIKGSRNSALMCDPETLEKCSDREKEYIAKARAKYDREGMHSEYERIMRISEELEEKSHLLSWAKARAKILMDMLSKIEMQVLEDLIEETKAKSKADKAKEGKEDVEEL